MFKKRGTGRTGRDGQDGRARTISFRRILHNEENLDVKKRGTDFFKRVNFGGHLVNFGGSLIFFQKN